MVRLILFAALALLLSHPVSAEEYTFAGDELRISDTVREWSEFTASLPEDIQSEVDGFLEDGGEDRIRESASLGYWADKLISSVSTSAGDVVSLIAPVFALLLVTASTVLLTPDDGQMSASLSGFVTLVCVLILFRGGTEMIDSAREYLSRLVGTMNLMLPMIEAICVSSGELTQAAVSATSLMFGVALVGNFAYGVLLPITEVILKLSAVSHVCYEVKIGSLVSSVRKLLMRLWQYMCIFFSFLLAAQTTIARSADNLVTRGVKFAIGSFIPIAGGMLSEAFNTVGAGLSFIRSAVGIGGIVVLMLMTLPAIVPLLLYRLSLTVSAECARLLRLDSLASLLDDFGGIMELVVAITLCSSLMLVFALVIFAKIGVGG